MFFFAIFAVKKKIVESLKVESAIIGQNNLKFIIHNL